jgi:ferredoxin-NADP reductase
VEVVGRLVAARDVVTLWLAQPGTTRAPAPYLPGQFITLALPTNQGTTISRSYSLCGDGSPERPWEITVKRQHAGMVSSYLFDRVGLGTRVQARGPFGSFTLPRDLRAGMPLVFVSLGSGIAPIYGMLRALAHLAPLQRPRVQLHYAYHSPADAIYGRELAALDPQRSWLVQWHYVSTSGARISPEQVFALVGAGAAAAHWYVCGPAGFKRALEAVLVRRGVPAPQIHAEVFASPRGPAAGTSAAAPTQQSTQHAAVPRGAGARVRLADRNVALEARPGETLLETLERHGYHPAYDCRVGACGTCRLRLLAGQVSDAGEALRPGERAAGAVLSCVAIPRGDVTLASANATRSVAGAVGAASAQRVARRSGRRAIRWGLAAASLSVFVGAWTLTQSASASQAATTPGSVPAPTATPCSSSFRDDGSCSSSLPSGSSGITTQPTPTPNTHTGVSR